MRVAITGSAGRLGTALVAALADAPFTGLAGPLRWTRADFDLDAPASAPGLLDRDRPEAVVHVAAWTDVDGCARDPERARQRNAEATGVLARACADRGIDLIVISTNEVFDGRRTDGRGYRPDDPTGAINPYGQSKLAGEAAATAAFGQASETAQLAIVRTAWLFGPGKPDFPTKILAAAERAEATGRRLRVTGDELGNPTYVADVAEGVVELLGSGTFGGVHHLVNGLFASRADWARYVVGRAGLHVVVENVSLASWDRPSTPPRWGVLEPSPLPSGEMLRPWPDAMADYAPSLLRQRISSR